MLPELTASLDSDRDRRTFVIHSNGEHLLALLEFSISTILGSGLEDLEQDD